jgi:hypothetical protein
MLLFNICAAFSEMERELIVCLLGDCVKLRIRSKYQNLILYFMQFADPFSVRAGRRTANWTKARQQYNQI